MSGQRCSCCDIEVDECPNRCADAEDDAKLDAAIVARVKAEARDDAALDAKAALAAALARAEQGERAAADWKATAERCSDASAVNWGRAEQAERRLAEVRSDLRAALQCHNAELRERIEHMATGQAEPAAPALLVEAQWAPEHVGLPGDAVVPAGMVFDLYQPDVCDRVVVLRIDTMADDARVACDEALVLRRRWLDFGASEVRIEVVCHD